MNATPAVTDRPVVGRLEPLRAMPLGQVRAAMAEYQDGLQALLDDSDWQSFTDRRDGSPKQFVKRSGWRKVATWFGLDLLVRSTLIERVAARVCPKCGHAYIERGTNEGDPQRALVTARAVAPNGRAAEDVGACSLDERRFSKPEHDLIATATTRALNRATSNLVGMGELSAEEVGDAEPTPVPLPDWAQPASDQLLIVMRAKLGALVGEQRAHALERAIAEQYGYLPTVTTGLVTALHSMLASTSVEATSDDAARDTYNERGG